MTATPENHAPQMICEDCSNRRCLILPLQESGLMHALEKNSPALALHAQGTIYREVLAEKECCLAVMPDYRISRLTGFRDISHIGTGFLFSASVERLEGRLLNVNEIIEPATLISHYFSTRFRAKLARWPGAALVLVPGQSACG